MCVVSEMFAVSSVCLSDMFCYSIGIFISFPSMRFSGCHLCSSVGPPSIVYCASQHNI